MLCVHNILFYLPLNFLINMRPNQTVCFNIKASWHTISRMYNEQAVKNDLTTAIGYVLLNIDTQKGTPATKIAPVLGMEPRSLTRMLKNLEDQGLIYRQQDEEDKRLIKVFLTDKGKEKKELAKKAVKRFNQVVREEIPEEKLTVFFEVIEKINNILEQKNIFK
jgi:MarR family transcriptional regulator, organic hydroperoxide resistance regulator